ncbi:MAG: hypothetical protein K2X32_00800, partial [Phycisphaerales bacterium]|nr:hypothetical protein [Phycisphaerales bacterium]
HVGEHFRYTPGVSTLLVIQTEHLDEEPAAWLRERCRLEVCDPSDAAFPALLAQADGLLIRTYTRVTPALLDMAPRLKVVARAGVGLDNVDLPACKARGVRVLSTPDANTSAVVEYVFALLLDATRPRLFLGEAIDGPRWKEVRQELRARRQLRELTLGILGFGRIGTSVARVARELGMTVIFHDVRQIPLSDRHGAESVSLEDLCARADAFTIHIDGRPENRGFVNADIIGRLKSDVILINTSRGFVMNDIALADFMIAHPAAVALLDVHEPEPFDATHPLLEIANVHLSPHIASATDLAQKNMSWVVRDLWAVLSG